MNGASLTDFLAMGGYGLYVWGALGMCVTVVVAELALLKARRLALMREAAHALKGDAQDSDRATNSLGKARP